VSATRLALSSAVAVKFKVTLVLHAPLLAVNRVEIYSAELIALQHATIGGRGVPLIAASGVNQYKTTHQLPAHTSFKVRWLIVNTVTDLIVHSSSQFSIKLTAVSPKTYSRTW